jgi:phage gp46-like protein
MTDLFDGDPFIDIGEDGADFIFNGGQPVMDQAFDNHVNISLLTKQGWWGNDIETVAERKIGSLYFDAVKKPITRQSLIDDDKAAVADLKGDEFGSITSETINPTSNSLLTEILFTNPIDDLNKLLLTRTGQNWVSLSEQKKFVSEKPKGIVVNVELQNLQTLSGDNITTLSSDQVLAKVKQG